MRTVFTWFAGAIAWGYAGFFARDHGISSWVLAIAFTALGIAFQLAYARLINTHFHSVGLVGESRWRLRTDRGIVPFPIQALGVIARAALVAGVVMPILGAVGWIRLDSVLP